MTLNLGKDMKPIAGMWPKQSANGNVYFAGGNRKEKLFLFHNADAKDGEPEWTLYSQAKAGSKPKKRANPSKAALQLVRATAKPDDELNDSIADLWAPVEGGDE